MANIMNMKRIKNNPSRNGFDLSTKRNFTAKVGELLPVLCQEVIPGDRFYIDISAFSRTQPLNTAAFARVKEYYDVFYVPYSLLWNRANVVLSQMNYNLQHSSDPDPSVNKPYSGELPYITLQRLQEYITTMSAIKTGIGVNYFGYSRGILTAKLAEYLGYGLYYNVQDGEVPPMRCNVDVNLFPFLAYQKIYSDFFRNEQWEVPDPTTFNVDYMNGQPGEMFFNYDGSSDGEFYTHYNMFDLRYANWPKDLYHGLIPSPQYGDEAAVPLTAFTAPDGKDYVSPAVVGDFTGTFSPKFETTDSDIDVQTIIKSSAQQQAIGMVGYTVDGANTMASVHLNNFASASGGLGILALRQAEFLQKWKEIAGSGDQNYKDMTKRIWGVDVSEHLAERVRYLGGVSCSIDINEVVNTNITGENAADIAGKGVGVSNGKIKFNSDGQYGLIMVIYHAMPQVDYTVPYLNPSFTRVNAEDFANPVFDKIGMEAVTDLSIRNDFNPTGRPDVGWTDTPVPLGYAPRYIDYKTGIDLSFGGFKFGDLKSWVIQYDTARVYDASIIEAGSPNAGKVPSPDEMSPTAINYTFFKVNPNLLDSIMSVAADSTVETDQLLCSCYMDIKAVRNLDVDGLPY